ncbi:STM4012 family radical SAM protein [Paenibacillus campi]|uniref:STM4012 family radical SAM protein n=1 Tax=Paenibacillus campi TaxID=3106031 RepID=UPI002AFEF97C|nr:STM4012 family radical SAM protein [Paenibacillus sp. SGZ-1014]
MIQKQAQLPLRALTQAQWTPELRTWEQELTAAPYRSYLYSYPHKTAYRELNPPLALEHLWAQERLESYFLYMHIPFCAARCGFCNLFTLPDKRLDVHTQYVDALERQAQQWAPFMQGTPFSRFAIGGGTPTLLAPEQLKRLFDIAERVMGVQLDQTSISVETSPDTVTADRLDILRSVGVDRISMGIQSFIEAESKAIYRPQNPALARRALELLKRYEFPLLNVDLIYGLPGQTVDSWLYSLQEALAYEPGEIFIYPLYVREHTILKPGQTGLEHDIRMELYEAARTRLIQAGYTQYSMRRFAKPFSSHKSLLPYSCQEEGMVGLGCGARSYTRDVHYASRYGVSVAATRSIIANYVAADRYDVADYGFVLNEQESRRRFVLKALLHREGLEQTAYTARFGSLLFEDLPELKQLVWTGLAMLEQPEQPETEGGTLLTEAAAYEHVTDDDADVTDAKARLNDSAIYAEQRLAVDAPYAVAFDHNDAATAAASGLADQLLHQGVLRLTARGMALSDSIGDWLISPEVYALMERYEGV